MTSALNFRAQCLCKAVTVLAAKVDPAICACHCDMCRTWAGSAFLSVDCGAGVSFEGEAHVRRYDSSPWAQRGFCAQCGTHLFYYLKAEQRYAMPVGLFADTDALVFDSQIFIDEKPHYYSFADHTAMMTGEEAMAAYQNKE